MADKAFFPAVFFLNKQKKKIFLSIENQSKTFPARKMADAAIFKTFSPPFSVFKSKETFLID